MGKDEVQKRAGKGGGVMATALWIVIAAFIIVLALRMLKVASDSDDREEEDETWEQW